MKFFSFKTWFTGLCAFISVGLLTQCSAIKSFKQSVQLRNRLFVRIPGELPREGLLSAGHWNFKHVAEGSGDNSAQTKGCWYMAWTDEETHKRHWRLRTRWGRARADLPELADAAKEVFGVYPQLVEPNRLYPVNGQASEATEFVPAPMTNEAPELASVQRPKRIWPTPSSSLPYLEHLERSGLLEARKIAGAKAHGVRVAILDDGFDVRHKGTPEPERLIDEPRGDAVGVLGCALSAVCRPLKPGSLPSPSGHGTGPLGILAGREVQMPGEIGSRQFGALPNSPIILVKVAPWVASVSTANLAYGIDYASRVQKADVITMSHGGSPSLMWADTVNAAYERGTLIIGAAANHYNNPFLPWGIGVPSTTLYPAAFNRVQGVSGITFDNAPYARTSFRHYLKPWNLLKPMNLVYMRGNYGPDGYWVSSHPFGPAEKQRIEQPTVEAGGLLRAHQLSAYTPNIPWLKAPSGGKHKTLNTFTSAGGGTSSATPQVASAAALWLAQNKAALVRSGVWNSWQKPEAAMVALLATADRTISGVRGFVGNDHRKLEDQTPDLHLGAGVIRANQAMKMTFDQARQLNGETLKFPTNPNGAPRDRFDGDHSLVRLLFRSFDVTCVQDPNQVLRLRLNQTYTETNQRQQALEDLYFNLELARQWQWGRMPLKKKEDFDSLAAPRRRLISRLWTRDADRIERHASDLAKRANAKP